MSIQPHSYLTPEEYLAIEREAEFKSEYYNGQMFAMAGAKRRHNLAAANIAGEIGNQLKQRPGEVYIGHMRVRVSDTGLYTYPDVVAACEEILFEDEEEDTLLNPVLIVEVLSRSTEAYDRGDKFEFYRKLDSLMDFVLITQNRMRVEHYTRKSDGTWLLSELTLPHQTVQLAALQCEILLSEIYSKVKLLPELP
ncbi:MAG: Uma2 family endonuclease [Armatimonadota bacterium]|nr:Uma2 family endonuclease [Armatimonadota bacterium]